MSPFFRGSEIISYFVDLAQNPFGNYGIQYIMENWGNNELNDIKNKNTFRVFKSYLGSLNTDIKNLLRPEGMT